MRIVRLLLQFTFALLFVAGVTILLSNSKNNVSGLGLMAVAIAFIALLGPLWPNQENLSKWAAKSNFNLPTDDPKVAQLVIYVLVALYSVYQAWRVFTLPPSAGELVRFEKLAYSIAGPGGVIAFWICIATLALTSAHGAYKKSQE
jgi:hypothetical protein